MTDFGSSTFVEAEFAGMGSRDRLRLGDPPLVVPSGITARIQEMHMTPGQMLRGALEQSLGLA